MNTIKKPYLLAIDGPAGSGKGTVAKLLSKKLSLKCQNLFSQLKMRCND